MANELSMGRPYVDAYAALEEGRQRALARRQEEEANALAQAVRAASARAVRNGMVDPRLLGEELAQSGYAYAIPGAQEKLFATEKAAGEAAEATGKGKSAGTKALADKLQLFRERLPVNNPRLLPAWVESVYADPEVGSFMSEFGSKEDAIAGIPKDDPVKLNEWMEAASMLPSEYMKRISTTAAEELTAATTRRGQDITATTARRGQDITAKTARERLDFDVTQAGKKAEGAVDAGRNEVNTQVATLRDYYRQLSGLGGITDVTKTPLENLQAAAASSPIGQAVGRGLGTEAQSIRNKIKQQRPLLLQAVKRATGMTAKQMDSNVELQLYLSAATDPTLDLQANLSALDNLDKLYGLGAVPEAAPVALNEEDQQALDWANANPKDPRAAKIKARLSKVP